MGKVDQKEIEEIKNWIRNEAKGLPVTQSAFLLSTLDMVSSLLSDKTTQKKAIETLRMALGILPKSERGHSDKFDQKVAQIVENESKNPEREKLESQIRTLLNKHRRLYGSNLERHKEGKKARRTRKNPLNGGEETLYNKTHRDTSQEERPQTVKRTDHFSNLSGLRSSTETAIRHDFDITIKTTKYHIETVTDPRTGQSVRASMDEIGPEGWQVTWNAMVNIVHLVVVFAMPAHRAAAFLGNTQNAFGESTILRILQFVARAAAPIYEVTYQQMARSVRLQGDDSSTRVLAVEKQVRDAEGKFINPHLQLSNEGNDDSSENKDAKEIESSPKQCTPPLMTEVIEKTDSVLGFEFATVTGKPKKRLQLSMVTGRIVAEDQFSQISLVRTHLGSFGNLLERLLCLRKIEDEKRNNLIVEKLETPKEKQAFRAKLSKTQGAIVTVQSDLSPANHAPESHGFEIVYAGCLAHARRPFWRYRDIDPLNCYFLLRGFALLSVIEDIIDCTGRTEDVSAYWRGRFGQRIWNILKKRCENMLGEHMPSSELYLAAKYVITHFTALTRYLHNPWLNPTNNQVERTLRAERTMLNNSKFRQSRTGRQTYDILRTIQLCCAGADVSILDYLKWMLINHKKVALEPEKWTPYAYRSQMKASHRV